MALFGRKAKVLRAPPDNSAAAELLRAARDGDRALAALSVAMAAHRAARTRLCAETATPQGKAVVNGLWSARVVYAAIAHFGLERDMQISHVMRGHRRSLERSAEAVIDATAADRPTPVSEPAAPGELQEA